MALVSVTEEAAGYDPFIRMLITEHVGARDELEELSEIGHPSLRCHSLVRHHYSELTHKHTYKH